MEVSFQEVKLPTESQYLADFLASQKWPFHVHSTVTTDQIEQAVKEGNYSGPENRTFWIVRDAVERVGVIKLFDLEDIPEGAPLFDIRILSQFHGRGIGQLSVRWLTRHLFEGHPNLNRIEATTRTDNRAMRSVLNKCGYVKEGHYRNTWPTEQGNLIDAVRYSILRSDWLSGKVTPVNWADSAAP